MHSSSNPLAFSKMNRSFPENRHTPERYMIPCSFGPSSIKRFSAGIIEKNFANLQRQQSNKIEESLLTVNTDPDLSAVLSRCLITEDNCQISERRKKLMEKVKLCKSSN